MRALVLIAVLVTTVASCDDLGTTFPFDSGPVSDGAKTDVLKADAGPATDGAQTDAPRTDAGPVTDAGPAIDGGAPDQAGGDRPADSGGDGVDSGADLSVAEASADLASTNDGADDVATTGDAE